MKPRICLLLLPLILAACQSEPPPPPSGEGTAGTRPTNRIDIPPTVVANLGITFATVERRHVSRTLRLPGAFESPPEATRAYLAPLGGRVELLVRQYQRVEKGQALYRLESAEFLRLLHEISDADAETAQLRADIAIARAELDAMQRAVGLWPGRLAAKDAAVTASEEHGRNLGALHELWAGRVTQLEELEKAGGGRATELAEARSRRAEAAAAISEEAEKRAGLNAELADMKAGMEADRARVQVLATSLEKVRTAADSAEVHAQLVRLEAAAVLGVPASELAGDDWRRQKHFTALAVADGVVSLLDASDGATISPGAPVLHTRDDRLLRFRARALQADLGLVQDGLDASVVPPAGGPLAAAAPLQGKLQLAPEADADSRTFDVVVTLSAGTGWARPGLTADLEVVYDRTAEPRLAIPLACVMQDGLDKIFFRRDPMDPNKVIRITASLGINDGRWVAVNTGVIEGDEVVLHGAYELKLTGAGKASGKGHFHADGTWHEGDH